MSKERIDITTEEYEIIPLSASKNQPKKQLGIELIDAATKGNVKKVRELIAKGADVNHPYNNVTLPKNTALIIAILNNHNEVVRELCGTENINLNLRTINGNTPLITALENDNYEAAEILVKAGVEKQVDVVNHTFNKESDLEENTLHYFVSMHNAKQVEFLLKNKANPNIVIGRSYTPLHHVSITAGTSPHTALPIVKLLIEYGADLNVLDNGSPQRTPIEYILRASNLETKEYTDLLTLMIANGANFEIDKIIRQNAPSSSSSTKYYNNGLHSTQFEQKLQKLNVWVEGIKGVKENFATTTEGLRTLAMLRKRQDGNSFADLPQNIMKEIMKHFVMANFPGVLTHAGLFRAAFSEQRAPEPTAPTIQRLPEPTPPVKREKPTDEKPEEQKKPSFRARLKNKLHISRPDEDEIDSETPPARLKKKPARKKPSDEDDEPTTLRSKKYEDDKKNRKRGN